MNPRKFLLGIGIAVSTLISSSLGANAARVDPKPPESPKESLTPRGAGEESKVLLDPIVQSLAYQTKSEQHLLLLRKPRSGNIYADHSSHGSHGSHGSHSSGN